MAKSHSCISPVEYRMGFMSGSIVQTSTETPSHFTLNFEFRKGES